MVNAINISAPSKLNDQNKWAVSFTINDNVDRNINKYIEKLKFNVKSNKTNSHIASCFMPINYAERGPAGPSSTGVSKLPYPMGTWDAATTYKNTDTSSPFVFYKNKYYILTSDAGVVCQGKTPGTTTGTQYWSEMKEYSSIYAKFLMADNASFGSKNGTIFYNNFMYSQSGIDDEQNFKHYSELDNVGDIFYNPENSSVSKLTGKFTPNTSIDFYSGSISCNKLIEQFDNFYLFDVNNTNNIIFNNTYFMDLKKSHNLNIMSRYLDISKVLNSNNSNETYYIARPGVVVLPKYDGDSEDGINIFINYPVCRPQGKSVYPTFNLFESFKDINTDSNVFTTSEHRKIFTSNEIENEKNGWEIRWERIYTCSSSRTVIPSIPTGNDDANNINWVPDGWYGSEDEVKKICTPDKPYIWVARRVGVVGAGSNYDYVVTKKGWSSFSDTGETTIKFETRSGNTTGNLSISIDVDTVTEDDTTYKFPRLWDTLECKIGQETTNIHSTNSNIDTLSEGYVMVCADSGIFDTSNYLKVIETDAINNSSTWNFKYTSNIDDNSENSQINTNMFVWKGYISNFILLAPGSKLKLKSNMVVEQYIDVNTSTNANRDTIIKEIKNSRGNTLAVVRKRIVGRQWVVENSDDFQPIPLHVKIDNMESGSSNYISYSNINKTNDKIDYSKSTYDTFVGLFDCDIPHIKNKNPIALGSTLIDFDFIKGDRDKTGVKTGVKPTYNHSIFYNNSMATKLNYSTGKYMYPLVIELNIHPQSYTSTWNISDISKNKAYNSTRIYRWGVLDNPYIHITSGNGSNIMAY